jgi:hypothetical protein
VAKPKYLRGEVMHTKTKYICLFAVMMVYQLAWTLPPQITAVNQMIVGSHLLDYHGSNVYLDKSGTFHLLYYDTDQNHNGVLKYKAVRNDGSIAVDSKYIVNCERNECWYKIQILADSAGMIHILLGTDFRLKKNRYLLLDNKGNLVEDITLPSYDHISGLSIYDNNKIMINGVEHTNSGQYYHLFFLKGPNQEKFKKIHIRKLTSSNYSWNETAIPCKSNKDLFFLIGQTKDENTKSVFLSKTLVDLKHNKVKEFQYFLARDSASYFYMPIKNDVVYGTSNLVFMGDTIIYRFGLETVNPGVRNDTMCVILFDRNGNVIKNKAPEYRNLIYRDINNTSPGDVLVKNNYNFKASDFNSHNPTIFGISTFRDFPDIIIDVESKY